MRILILVPKGAGGVRDYADQIAERLGEASQSVVVEPIDKDWTAKITLKLKNFDCVYLQYSGYGYARRGAPLWLLQFLKKHRSSIRRLGIFFHELYAFGWPWSSAFWLSPVQKHIARELEQISDFWVTNRTASAQWLGVSRGRIKGAVLPVCSNMGERTWSESPRSPNVLVFGSAPLRARAYSKSGSELFVWAQRSNFTIHDVGPALNKENLEILDRFGVIRHGRVTVEKFAEIAGNSRFGVVAYPSNYLSKSGVLAAYCTFGVAPVILWDLCRASDGLEPSVHYYDMGILGLGDCPPDRNVGAAAWKWYQDHTIQRHVEIVLNNL